ncbi:hypothetical protein Y032_0006g3101 [Ancylostoma ceylanicum]|uniref:Uncharacterized protein n=1 Tax=Ancylostoma ceylanicum TaxID=53326 RepID=A0A016VRJ4_9BILA|nr:hypothetical protein Y032_0006g3101 [Ancylostoma ceylanicum]
MDTVPLEASASSSSVLKPSAVTDSNKTTVPLLNTTSGAYHATYFPDTNGFTDVKAIVLRIVIGGAFALVFVIIFTILYCCFRSGSGKRPSKNTKSTPETTRSTGAESSSSAITDSSESRAMISATTTSATAATTVTGQTRTQPDHSL